MRSITREGFARLISSLQRPTKDDGIVVESFPTSSIVNVRRRDSINDALSFPIGGVCDLDVEDIGDELDRWRCVANSGLFAGRYKTRRFIAYRPSSALFGLISKIVARDNYASYHIFCDNNASYNTFSHLYRYHNKAQICINTPEEDTFSMFSILRNEYGEYYNAKNGDDVLIFFDKYDSLPEYALALNSVMVDCYCCMKHNLFVFNVLKFTFRDTLVIENVYSDCGYMIFSIHHNSQQHLSYNMVAGYVNCKIDRIIAICCDILEQCDGILRYIRCKYRRLKRISRIKICRIYKQIRCHLQKTSENYQRLLHKMLFSLIIKALKLLRINH